MQQLKEVLELMEPNSSLSAPSDVCRLIQLVNRAVSRLVNALGLEKASGVLAEKKVARLRQSLYLCKTHVTFMSQDRSSTCILPRGSSISGGGAFSSSGAASPRSSGSEISGSSSIRNSSAGGASGNGSSSGGGYGSNSSDHGGRVTCPTISEHIVARDITSSDVCVDSSSGSNSAIHTSSSHVASPSSSDHVTGPGNSSSCAGDAVVGDSSGDSNGHDDVNSDGVDSGGASCDEVASSSSPVTPPSHSGLVKSAGMMSNYDVHSVEAPKPVADFFGLSFFWK